MNNLIKRASRNRQTLPVSTYTFTNVGATADQTSSGSFNRFTQTIYSYFDIWLYRVVWNIFTTQTYNLEIVNSTAASPTVLATLVSGASLTGGSADNTLDFPRYYIPAGTWYLSLYCATAVRQRRNAVHATWYTPFSFGAVGYDGGSTNIGQIPARLTFDTQIVG